MMKSGQTIDVVKNHGRMPEQCGIDVETASMCGERMGVLTKLEAGTKWTGR